MVFVITPIANRAAFVAEVTMRVEEDARVVPYSVTTEILKWDEKSLTASVRWRFYDVDQPQNIVLQYDKSTKELLIRDANPDPASFSAHIPAY